jgi:isopenicillin N synthase-like dioxygenase
VDYADIPIIDLNQAQTLEGRAGLVVRVREAMSRQGFFYAINHGYTRAEV